MCNPLEEMKKKEQQVPLSATQQLNQERREHPRELMTAETVEQHFEKMKDQLLSRRVELYEMGQVSDLQLEYMPEKRPQMPRVSQLSDCQRNKVASKRANNLKKAQKKHLTGATADTLPMQTAVKQFYKKATRHPVTNDGVFQFDRKLFSPDFPEEQDCSIDVKKGMTTLAKLKKARMEFEADHSGYNDFKIVASLTNFRLIEPLENALRTVLAANGIDIATGGAIREEQHVIEARVMRQHAIAAYEQALASVQTTLGEVAEEQFSDRLQEIEKVFEENDRATAIDEARDLDFAITYSVFADKFAKVRAGIDSHPEEYAKHREIIDRSYQIYLDAQKRAAKNGRRIKALNQLGRSVTDQKMKEVLDNRADAIRISPEMSHTEYILEQQEELIRFLTEHRPFSEKMQYMYRVIEEEYGIHTEERTAQKHEMEVYTNLREGQKEVVNRLHPAERERLLASAEEIQGLEKRRTASMEAHESLLANCSKDTRVIRLLLHGAQVNKSGAPINVEEGRHMLEDRQRIKAYLSDDPTISGPLLAPIVEEILSYPYLEVDVSKEVWENTNAFLNLLYRNVYMQNMIQDHPEYFATLPEKTMQQLDAAMVIGVRMSAYAGAIATAQGLNFNYGLIYDSREIIAGIAKTLPEYKASFEAAREKFRQAQ